MLETCRQIAEGNHIDITSDAQANVVSVAAKLCRSKNEQAARELQDAALHWFEYHPDTELSTQQVIQRGWIISLPRFRSMLDRELKVQ